MLGILLLAVTSRMLIMTMMSFLLNVIVCISLRINILVGHGSTGRDRFTLVDFIISWLWASERYFVPVISRLIGRIVLVGLAAMVIGSGS